MRLGGRSRTVAMMAAAVAVAAAMSAVVVVLQARNSTATASTDTDASKRPSQDGRMIVVNGHKLFVRCVGAGSPTVILDGGLGDSEAIWRDAMTGATRHRVRLCAYDRWGVGHSDPNPAPDGQTIGQAATELGALLSAARLKPPYVFVSHSIAGLIHRTYTKRHPGQVRGLVMVDTAPDDWDLFTGLTKFTWGTETLRYLDDEVRLRERDDLGQRPTIVIQAETENMISSDPAFIERYWGPAQRKLATLSKNSAFVVADGSDHNVPEAAPNLVAAAIGLVVDSTRTGRALPSCQQSSLPTVGGVC